MEVFKGAPLPISHLHQPFPALWGSAVGRENKEVKSPWPQAFLLRWLSIRQDRNPSLMIYNSFSSVRVSAPKIETAQNRINTLCVANFGQHTPGS